MPKPHGLNGKARTHFEQIPVALVEKIAIIDCDDELAAADLQREPDRRTPASPPTSENES